MRIPRKPALVLDRCLSLVLLIWRPWNCPADPYPVRWMLQLHAGAPRRYRSQRCKGSGAKHKSPTANSHIWQLKTGESHLCGRLDWQKYGTSREVLIDNRPLQVGVTRSYCLGNWLSPAADNLFPATVDNGDNPRVRSTPRHHVRREDGGRCYGRKRP